MKHLSTLLQIQHRRHWRLLLAALLAVVSWFAFKPSDGAETIQHLDKLQHIAAFTCLALVAALGWPKAQVWAWRIALGLALYGVFIELVQTQLPTRTGSVADWLADAVGIALGLWMSRLMPRAD